MQVKIPSDTMTRAMLDVHLIAATGVLQKGGGSVRAA